MHPPCAPRAGGADEVVFLVPSPASEAAFVLTFAEIRSRASLRGAARFVIDCDGTGDLPGRISTDLENLRIRLKYAGVKLELRNCGTEKRQRSSGPVVPPAAHQPHPLRGPGAAFLRKFRAGT
jgi:hypothetical protein